MIICVISSFSFEGAKLTATDLPEILGNLRCNLNRNTRWYRRHEPEVLALSWGHELEETFPRSAHLYDYILAADVVYHHDFLPELLATMRHFCQRGTTLIWANKIRYQSDLLFVENFQKAFNSTLLTEMDEVRIYSATARGCDEREDRWARGEHRGYRRDTRFNEDQWDEGDGTKKRRSWRWGKYQAEIKMDRRLKSHTSLSEETY